MHVIWDTGSYDLVFVPGHHPRFKTYTNPFPCHSQPLSALCTLFSETSQLHRGFATLAARVDMYYWDASCMQRYFLYGFQMDGILRIRSQLRRIPRTSSQQVWSRLRTDSEQTRFLRWEGVGYGMEMELYPCCLGTAGSPHRKHPSNTN